MFSSHDSTRKECEMETSPRVSPQQFAESMKEEIEQYRQGGDGGRQSTRRMAQWIAGSEEQVRDLSAEMRRRIFERAVQKRVDAAEAAFPPSAPSDDGQAAGE